MSRKENGRNGGVALAALAGLLGCGLILYTTRLGPVIYSDSVGYLATARNILAGHGIGIFLASGQFSPVTIQPPFYPLLLAVLGLSGTDLVALTRILHAIFFGLVIFLSAVGLLRLSGSLVFAAAGALVVLASPLLIQLFSMAMTEPTFMLLGLGGLLLLLLALRRDHLGWLAAAAVCVGLASLTRYVGAAWIAAGALAVLIFWPERWKRRLGALACFGGVAVLPLAAWVGWVQLGMGRLPRSLNQGVDVVQRLIEVRLAFVDVFWNWLPVARLVSWPYRLQLAGLLALAGLLVTMVIFSAWQARRKQAPADRPGWRQDPFVRASSLLWLSLVAYLGLNAFGYVYSNPLPDLNERTLSMGMLLGLGIILVACAALARTWPGRWWGLILPLACVAVMVVPALPQSVEMVRTYHASGEGYLAIRWRNSETIREAMALPVDVPLISNEFSALEFWCGRPVYPLREVTELASQPLEARFGDDAEDAAQRAFRQDGAALVLFDSLRWQLSALYYEQTPDRIGGLTNGLRLAGEYWDGAMYFYPAEQP